MSDVIYMFAMSLDGFIAREDGRFDWLEAFPADAEFDFDTFLDGVGAIVMGRGTYDAVRREGRWDYARWPTIVATSRPVEDLPPNAAAMAAAPAELLVAARSKAPDGRVWLLGGGDLVRQFLDAGLLDVVEVGIIPVIIGSGLPAFGGAQADRWLKLEFARSLANGAIHARYGVKR